MEPFNPEAKCVKCSQTDINAVLTPPGIYEFGDSFEDRRGKYPERIVRICRTCGFQWNELPHDAKEQSKN
jgi:hypothetical protein